MFSKKRLNHRSLILFACLLFLLHAVLAQAEEQPPRDEPDPSPEELMELVLDSLPDVIKEDNTQLAARLLKPALGPPLREVFKPGTAIPILFGRGGAPIAPGCKSLYGPSGDIDRGECQASKGDEAGEGPYKEFRFSKHMSIGNISFFDRPAVMPIDPLNLQPIKMTDEQAYALARNFLQETFGLPEGEIPSPPPDAILPVRTIALGGAMQNDKGEVQKFDVPVEKMVILQRGLYVGLGGEHGEYDWIPGPGQAMVVMDDRPLNRGGLREVAIRGWQEVQPHPDANPEMAKSRKTLGEEIVQDLLVVSTGRIHNINCRLVLNSVPTSSGVGLLLPAVQVYVSPVPADLPEEEQHKLAMQSTAGFVRNYNLVGLNETNLDQNEEN
jgi:hypothetical protein